MKLITALPGSRMIVAIVRCLVYYIFGNVPGPGAAPSSFGIEIGGKPFLST